MRKIVLLMLLVTAMPLFAQKSKKPASPASNELQQLIDSGADVQLPSFKNGDLNKFRAWLIQQIDYPTECLKHEIEGCVKVQFVIEKDGSIGRFEVLESPHELLTNEVLNAMKRSPRWKPLRVDGKASAVTYAVPIYFRIPPRAPRQNLTNEEDYRTNPYRKDVGRTPRNYDFR